MSGIDTIHRAGVHGGRRGEGRGQEDIPPFDNNQALHHLQLGVSSTGHYRLALGPKGSPFHCPPSPPPPTVTVLDSPLSTTTVDVPRK